MKERNAKPSMPWAALHTMDENDLRAAYRYIKSLGPSGEKIPAYVPPDQQPLTPYVNYLPLMPDGSPMPLPGTAPSPTGQ